MREQKGRSETEKTRDTEHLSMKGRGGEETENKGEAEIQIGPGPKPKISLSFNHCQSSAASNKHSSRDVQSADTQPQINLGNILSL